MRIGRKMVDNGSYFERLSAALHEIINFTKNRIYVIVFIEILMQ